MIGQRGQHVILYGERGVGKTSLANVLSAFGTLQSASSGSVKINCHTGDKFETLWANVFRELGDDSPVTVAPSDPEGARHALQQLKSPTLMVIDELDRLEDDDALSLLADEAAPDG